MADVSKRELEGLDDEYDKLPAPERKGGDRTLIPDGNYDAEITGADLVRSKADDPMVKFSLRIKGPKQAGRLAWKYSMVTRDGLERLKRDMFAVGLDDCKVSELPRRLPGVVGKVIAITLKSKGENQNVFLNRVVSDPDAGSNGNDDDAPPPSDGDFPF